MTLSGKRARTSPSSRSLLANTSSILADDPTASAYVDGDGACARLASPTAVRMTPEGTYQHHALVLDIMTVTWATTASGRPSAITFLSSPNAYREGTGSGIQWKQATDFDVVPDGLNGIALVFWARDGVWARVRAYAKSSP
jgi:hypothetical protein